VRVQKVAAPWAGEPHVELVDYDGCPVAEVAGFLRLLVVRDYSPNTVRAYAHDLRSCSSSSSCVA
jgi:integrase/recombinase XerD